MFSRKTLFAGSPLSPLQQRFLTVELQQGPPQADRCESAEVLLIWVAHMLHSQQFLDDMQWRLLLSEIKPYLDTVGPVLLAHCHENTGLPEDLPPAQLVFADGRYAIWPTSQERGYLDLETGEYRRGILQPVVTVAYHLETLAAREYRRCLSLENKYRGKSHSEPT